MDANSRTTPSICHADGSFTVTGMITPPSDLPGEDRAISSQPGLQLLDALAMTQEEYVTEILRTYAGADDVASKLTLGALGLAGESGEVVDLIKKHLFQGHPISRENVCDELGDVLWYFVLLCHTLDLTLEEVMARNVEKLRRRYPHGFEACRSQQREEDAGFTVIRRRLVQPQD